MYFRGLGSFFYLRSTLRFNAIYFQRVDRLDLFSFGFADLSTASVITEMLANRISSNPRVPGTLSCGQHC